MVNVRIVALIITLHTISACERHNSRGQPALDSDETVTEEALPEAIVTEDMKTDIREAELAARMSEEELGVFFSERTGRNPLPSGEWVERNGSIFCDGFLTRIENKDFCAAEIPDDWVPFEFDGQTYFIQPLNSADDQ